MAPLGIGVRHVNQAKVVIRLAGRRALARHFFYSQDRFHTHQFGCRGFPCRTPFFFPSGFWSVAEKTEGKKKGIVRYTFSEIILSPKLDAAKTTEITPNWHFIRAIQFSLKPPLKMNKSVFRITKMDCPSEEQLIRMKLAGESVIEQLQFDIPNRQLTVFHTGTIAPIATKLDELHLDTTLLTTQDAVLIELAEEAPSDRRLLVTVLLINAFFFLLEIATGLIARSMGLLADALDMLADALVYGLALYAVGRAVTTQKRIARLSGYFQLALAVGGLLEVLRRFSSSEAEPNFGLMMGISLLALLGNSACLYLLNRSRSQQAHMQASQIFTSNDVIATVGRTK